MHPRKIGIRKAFKQILQTERKIHLYHHSTAWVRSAINHIIISDMKVNTKTLYRLLHHQPINPKYVNLKKGMKVQWKNIKI